MGMFFFLLAVGFLAVILISMICGIIALVKSNNLSLGLRRLEGRIAGLESRLQKPEAEPVPPKPETPIEAGVPAKEEEEPEVIHLPPPPPKRSAPRQRPRRPLEVTLGTKWIVWAGVVMSLIGLGLGLKYAYDNDLIGPAGRLAIGTLAGVGALLLGERFRRKDWQVLFQSLTGAGIAAFYMCIYFSFQVYHLSGQAPSFVLAILVTLFAVVMAVAHNAVAIAIVGLVGGFLSPVLLSTGTNHPYVLFTYIAVLDLVALGAAYYRRWRVLDLLCFAGTALVYQGWYMKFYAPDQMAPALIYVTLFYLMFLLIPTFHSLVRRLPENPEGLVLVVFNAVFSFYCYYNVLFDDYRYVMGFVVLGQALLVLLLFRTWVTRVGAANRTTESLLIIALALITIAIPIQLKFYGIPIAWAVEGVMLVYLGIRFRLVICTLGGVLALLLAAGKLFDLMPLHTELFTPVFNAAFGSWVLVIAAAGVAAHLLSKAKGDWEKWNRVLAGVTLLLGFVLGCVLLTAEVSQVWTVPHARYFRNYQFNSLALLWSAIPAAVTYVLHWKQRRRWMALSWACYAVGIAVFLLGLDRYNLDSALLMLNYTFGTKLVFVLSLWWGGRVTRRSGIRFAGEVLESAGHVLLALLLAAELDRCADYAEWLSGRMALSLVSAAWAAQALALIWIGLATRSRVRRYLGFVLFGITVGKVLLVDTGTLEKVYRIVSFLATGLLMVVAGYFYQRYVPTLLEKTDSEEDP